MENNWREIAQDILINASNHTNKSSLDCMLEAMNLVFEATKKECSEKAELKGEHYFSTGDYYQCVDKDSILSINKPNL